MTVLVPTSRCWIVFTDINVLCDFISVFATNRCMIVVSIMWKWCRYFIFMPRSDPFCGVPMTGMGPGNTLHTRLKWMQSVTAWHRFYTKSISQTTVTTRSKLIQVRERKISVRTLQNDWNWSQPRDSVSLSRLPTKVCFSSVFLAQQWWVKYILPLLPYLDATQLGQRQLSWSKLWLFALLLLHQSSKTYVCAVDRCFYVLTSLLMASQMYM